MQQLLTGRTRLPQFASTPGQGGSRPLDGESAGQHGHLPASWTRMRLSKITERITRKNETGISLVLTASGTHGLVDQREFFDRSVAGADLSGYYHLMKGDFAYNRSSMNGYPYGAIKRLDHYPDGILSTLCICFRLTSPKCDSDFLVQYFEAGLLNRQLRGIAQVGARAHGLLNMLVGDFFGIKLDLPPHPEQQAIAAILTAADQELDHHRHHLAALHQQKKGLMQQLLTGSIRVEIKDQ